MITESASVAIAGLVAVVALLFLLLARLNWHVFIALLVPILLLALLPGIDRRAFIAAFEQGFGRTIQSIAVVIVLGSVLEEALKHTGGVERITTSMIGLVGERRMPLALTLSGFVIGIAIFSDIGSATRSAVRRPWRTRSMNDWPTKSRDSRMSLEGALISYGGVTFVNGVAAMAAVYVLWAVGLI